jgi:serine/threonine protein kinase
VAVKLFDKNQFWRLVVKGVERADTLVRECSTQATLTCRHPNLYPFIHLRGFLETSDHIILEMEYLDGTDLFHYVSRRGVLPESEAARILADLLQLIVAMNEVGLSHRDIKPANILIYHNQQELSSPPPSPSSSAGIKLCDYGMAAFAGIDGLVRGRCGTPGKFYLLVRYILRVRIMLDFVCSRFPPAILGYVAPEIFTAGRHGGYGPKVDVFSAGVTLYVMLCGYEPFYGTSDEELIEANRTAQVEFPPEEWSSVSKEAVSLVQSMMTVDPADRPSAQEVLAHPWLQEHVTTVLSFPEISSSLDSEDAADTCVIL